MAKEVVYGGIMTSSTDFMKMMTIATNYIKIGGKNSNY